MAMSIRSPAVTVAILTILACAEAYGGKTEIVDVKRNTEVQELGRFSVEEHNRRLKGEEEAAKFVEVVEAQKQVVSGIEYYMKIFATAQADGASRMFDSVVVVKPWLRSEQLLNFAPSAP
ncbi:hypothetical protein Fmac_004771 [Flemingia macrophylla]|uniref:Cystatin domain-containing protein n=1 Tax=Flemingia macrophylla TaxID=520843 RepID=A0ABD1N6I2_9FABA